MNENNKARLVIDSPIGPISLLSENDTLVGLYFGKVYDEWGQGTSPLRGVGQSPTVLTLCEKELAEYFAGELKDFTVPVRARGTPFREKVWAELRKIPYGKTVSYKDVAVGIGNEKAVRAVGGANHHNPVSIIIPCHRVLGADGSLTGYGGGMEVKQWLLDLEARYAG